MEALKQLDLALCSVPNALSEVGFWLKHDQNIFGILDTDVVFLSLQRLIVSKAQTFRYHLAPFSIKEKSVMVAIAKRRYANQPNSKEFLSDTQCNASSVRKIITKLLRLGVVEWEIDKGYRLSDPLESMFLTQF